MAIDVTVNKLLKGNGSVFGEVWVCAGVLTVILPAPQHVHVLVGGCRGNGVELAYPRGQCVPRPPYPTNTRSVSVVYADGLVA